MSRLDRVALLNAMLDALGLNRVSCAGMPDAELNEALAKLERVLAWRFRTKVERMEAER